MTGSSSPPPTPATPDPADPASMTLHEAMRTTFACRSWTDDPVDDATINRIIEVARFAPSGGNRQGTRVIVLRDPDMRRQVVDLTVPIMNLYYRQVQAGEAPLNTVVPTSVDVEAALAEPDDLLGHRVHATAPVLLVFTLDLAVVASMDSALDRVGVISGASVYPFVWNVLLAARAEGLAGTIVTGVASQEERARELLGVPEHHAIAAIVPLGKPQRQLTKLTRLPVDEIVRLDRYDGPALSPSD